MGYNFVAADRDQLMLLPPSVAEWLPDDHLAWFVLDTVVELDVSEFLAGYRADGRGGAAYDPVMMVGLLIYAYCVGERSSRRIEKRLVEDVAFRVIAANQQPDHATIARFRAGHEEAITGLFTQVLGVCERAGLVRPGLVAIDGTKMRSRASREANRTAAQLAAAILAEAAAIDAAEDAAAAMAGEESAVPPELRSRLGRRDKLRAMLDELNAEAAEKSYETQLARRAETERATGKKLGGRKPSPDSSKRKSRQHANTTDPDSRLMRTGDGYLQGFNAQAVSTEDQVVLAAQVTNEATDAGSFQPMVAAAKKNVKKTGSKRRVRKAVADAGYFTDDNAATEGIDAHIAPSQAKNIDETAQAEIERDTVLGEVENGTLTPTEAAQRLGLGKSRIGQLLRNRRRGKRSLTAIMIDKLTSRAGRKTYNKRAGMIEPVFGQIKHNRGITGFLRDGLAAANSEWNLICTTHNLLKVYRAA